MNGSIADRLLALFALTGVRADLFGLLSEPEIADINGSGSAGWWLVGALGVLWLIVHWRRR